MYNTVLSHNPSSPIYRVQSLKLVLWHALVERVNNIEFSWLSGLVYYMVCDYRTEWWSGL